MCVFAFTSVDLPFLPSLPPSLLLLPPGPPNYIYVVVIWLALSALLCCCCLACTTRRYVRCLSILPPSLPPVQLPIPPSLPPPLPPSLPSLSCLQEWRVRLQGEREGNTSSSSSSSLYDPLLGFFPSSLRPGQRQSQPVLPPTLALPQALTEEERAREERAEVFRNSLMEQGGREGGREGGPGGGEEEWVCAVCAFENR